jgi:ADP-heptose:LPS heptosyltransferase
MVRILVIQLDRMGDTLWITPLLDEISHRNAPCEISVLVRPEIADVLAGNPNIHQIVPADWLALPLEYPDLEGAALIDCYRRLNGVVRELREGGFDYVYNMNFNKMAATLTALIDAPNTIGFTVSKSGGRLIRGPWVNYLSSVVHARNCNSFNMVDIFRHFAPDALAARPLVFHIPESESREAARFLRKEGIDPDDLLIGFQPGASTPKKIWPPRHFARLGDRLAGEMGAKILLFGVEGERFLGEEIEQGMEHPVVNLMGKTSIAGLAAFLEKCRCLVSNDTGTIHLAAAAGTPKIAGLFFGFANFSETPPYGEGHLVFQPDIACAPCNWNAQCREGHKCHDALSPDAVFDVLGTWLERPSIALTPQDIGDHAGLGIYYSAFDPFGFLSLFPLTMRPLEAGVLVRLAYKLMWLQVLKREEDHRKRREYIELELKHYAGNGAGELVASLQRTMEALSKMEALCSEGASKAGELIKTLMGPGLSMTAVNELVGGMGRIDGEIEALGGLFEEMKPLAAAFSLDKQNLEGTGIQDLSLETLSIYRRAGARNFSFLEALTETMTVFQGLKGPSGPRERP